MSLSDPIGDMIARVKNAQARNHKKVELPSSNFKVKIAEILKNEGFVKDFKVNSENNKNNESKLLPNCTLPLTGQSVVDRIITNLGVLDVVEGGLQIVECADGVSVIEIKAATQAKIV